MKRITKEEALRLAGEGFGRIPLVRELYADTLTPINVLRILKGVSRHCFLLESAEASKKWGRYTFIGFDPKLELTCLDGVLRIREGTTCTERVAHPGEAIRRILSENRAPRRPELPPFSGGLVGYFSYDYIKYSEPTLKLDAADSESFQDVDLMLFDKVIVFDHFRQKVLLIVNMPTGEPATDYERAVAELDRLAGLLQSGAPVPNPPLRLKTPFTPLFDRASYCAMVDRGKRYIREGDLFQVVLSNRLEAEMEGSLLDVYRVLRTQNPSPYMFYFTSDEIEIAGASPETLVKLENGVLHTFPLAGTRPRGRAEAEDAALERELLADEKERAEHNMLVDLGRNDIGKISALGSVEVERYMEVLRFSHVMHIGSTVRGQLAEGRDAVDAIDAILPAGTLSGAPKLRACQIINELENNKRGIYGGAIGYLDFTGNLDTAIAIRLAFAKNGKLFIRSGAGIVADSVPAAEYQECINKAQAVVSACEIAEGGLDL